MIVRASGPLCREIHAHLTERADFTPLSAEVRDIKVGSLQIPAWVYCFAAPRSSTGQDVIELHVPGSPLIARLVLGELISRGARQAEAGEFTSRAYFNGILDLTQAEAVASLVSAENAAELAAARKLMAGELARRLRGPMDRLIETLALVEAGIDFSDEGVSFLPAEELAARVSAMQAELNALLLGSARFERLSHEPRIVFVGWPNAGKSTLINLLCGQQRSITAPTAGTTRDVLSVSAILPRGRVQLIDVAGIDESECDDISAAAQRNARGAIAAADVVVLMRDMTDQRPPPPMARAPELRLAGKCELGGVVESGELKVSAARGLGIQMLREQLDRSAFGASSAAGGLALNARHVQAVEAACEALAAAGLLPVPEQPELVAAELRRALAYLGEILGIVSPDELLGEIFSNFCIGK